MGSPGGGGGWRARGKGCGGPFGSGAAPGLALGWGSRGSVRAAVRGRRAAPPRATARSPGTSRVDGSSLPPPLIYIATVRISRDHFLPPDPNAFLAAEPATGRVVVIAPTRAACETIELAMSLDIDTLLAREHGEDISRLAASGRGFGIVAGTGTGKTLAIRPIATTILQTPLKVGVVNREREATPETPTWNVVIVTTGIARRWFEDGLITARDTLVVDEIHQTSAELELCLALGKRAGCRFIWLSATVDPAFYHGGEPIRVIRPFLDGEVRRPFLLAMTAAGQSALNIRGLDTVVIYDARYANVVERGRNVLTRLYLGANEILQMAGRVHGRVEGGEVYILSDRELVFDELRPTPPEFQLAGDAERVAITCAALGVDARELDLPVPLDRKAYRDAVELLTERGLIERGRLTRCGRVVEAMPVERPWGELLYRADPDLVPMVDGAASVESLHRMTREERDLRGLIVSGSDHLTAYNVYAEAVNKHGYLGEVYGLPRHLFRESVDRWAEGRGVLVKAIEDVALGLASVYRQIELPLPERLPHAGEKTLAAFADLVAKIQPVDLVIDEETADGREARVSRRAGGAGGGPARRPYAAPRSGTGPARARAARILLATLGRAADAGGHGTRDRPARGPARAGRLVGRVHQRTAGARRRSDGAGSRAPCLGCAPGIGPPLRGPRARGLRGGAGDRRGAVASQGRPGTAAATARSAPARPAGPLHSAPGQARGGAVRFVGGPASPVERAVPGGTPAPRTERPRRPWEGGSGGPASLAAASASCDLRTLRGSCLCGAVWNPDAQPRLCKDVCLREKRPPVCRPRWASPRSGRP